MQLPLNLKYILQILRSAAAFYDSKGAVPPLKLRRHAESTEIFYYKD